MRYSRQHHLTAYASLCAALLVVMIGQQSTTVQANVLRGVSKLPVGTSTTFDASEDTPDTMRYRIAKRLRNRLRENGTSTPSLKKLAEAVTQRQELLKKQVEVEVRHPDGTQLHTWEVSPQRYPLWISSTFSMQEARVALQKEAMAETLIREVEPFRTEPVHAKLRNIDRGEGVTRVTADVAKAGEVLPLEAAVRNVHDALLRGTGVTAVELEKVDGIVMNSTQEDLGELTLLASGRSNFKGSTRSRSFNVRKALREHVNNTLVAPGETFSFNSTLNGPVTLSNGWAMAKIIVNGADLEAAPGGGICQASTTAYRAILNAGLPVTERKSHSLYVSYYKQYGVGIDATIFPGAQDLVFRNDTGNYLLIQAYDDGYDAVVNIYGTPDGRTVDLAGPYFQENAPDDLRVNGRSLSRHEIAWLQKVRYPDGRVEENTIVSRYRTLPNYVRREFAYAE